MAMIAQILKRQFKSHEIQMINHPRVCAVCFESKPELLQNCKKCPQTSFCKEHLNDPSHKEHCLKMLTVFEFDNKGIRTQDVNVGDLIKVKIAHQNKSLKLPSSMDKFIDTYIDVSEMKDSITRQISPIKISFTSERLSRSLSLLFAMEKLKYEPGSKMLVHVVGASMEEIIVSDWEVILHWLPNLYELKLVLIGPNILADLEKIAAAGVCNLCKKNGKNLIIEIEIMLYEEYFKKPDFKKPDMIAAFNAGMYAYASWDKAIKAIGRLSCPLLLTSYSEIEAYREQEKISSMFGTAKCIYFQPNPFASMAYARNPVTEGTLSKNYFMLVYKSLHFNA